MTRKEIMKFLQHLLIQDRLSGQGKYYASEVSLDYGTAKVRRVDFMQFVPVNCVYVDGLEKGHFISYELKSCKSDYHSGYGKNFITEKNYFVMPISVYKELTEELKKEYGIGIMCPVPKYRDTRDEFKNPTPLDKTDIEWEMKILKPAKTKSRDKSLTELLFCMLRSGR